MPGLPSKVHPVWSPTVVLPHGCGQNPSSLHTARFQDVPLPLTSGSDPLAGHPTASCPHSPVLSLTPWAATAGSHGRPHSALALGRGPVPLGSGAPARGSGRTSQLWADAGRNIAHPVVDERLPGVFQLLDEPAEKREQKWPSSGQFCPQGTRGHLWSSRLDVLLAPSGRESPGLEERSCLSQRPPPSACPPGPLLTHWRLLPLLLREEVKRPW